MMKRILLAAALLAACGRGEGRGASLAAADTAPALAHDSASLWPERGFIVADSVMPEVIRQCSRETPDSAAVQGWWRPTPGQIRELEARLTPVLREALRKDAGPDYNPRLVSLYHRQYAGMVIRGRRIIYVNGYVPMEIFDGEEQRRPTDWTTTVQDVCDGGRAFFGVEYDPAKKRFRELHFNGVV